MLQMSKYIEFPPKIKDSEQFEKDNPNISTTIFECDVFEKIKEDKDEENTKEEIKINDVRVSPYALKRKHLVELLIIKDKINGISHYTTIKNLSRLFRNCKYDEELNYCKKCYCSFRSNKELEKIKYIFHYVQTKKMLYQ